MTAAPRPVRACPPLPVIPRGRALLLAGALAIGIGCPPGQVHSTPGAPVRAAAPGASPAPVVATATRDLTALADAGRDTASFARPDEVVIVDLELALDVIFAERRIAGVATVRVDRRDRRAPLTLDTRDLEITSVRAAAPPIGDAPPTWEEAPHRLGAAHPILGAPLVIDLEGDVDRVEVRYRTGEAPSGLHWLDPAQTADRRAPFLYSQSQAIHARSWVPIQDSPAIRFPFRAEVAVDRPLRPVMAAAALGEADGRHRFELREPIPAYLLAIAVGALEHRELGPRTGVWAEPGVLPRAAAELRDLEAMLAAIEADFGPYRWGRYEVLFLPPSFPYGGMENPRVTFATPTILAGDRSLVSLIAHELAHSWSGNLVTGRTWGDLWLNEGFTTYLERRILEGLYGRERAEMEAVLGAALLDEVLAEIPPADQALAPALAGRDPDEVPADVAYEKGALLLRALEEAHGRAAFDPFLRAWFDEHAFTSQTTASFVAFARARLLQEHPPIAGAAAVDLEAWIAGPGLPAAAPRPRSTAFAAVDEARDTWLSGQIDVGALGRGWTPFHWLHLLGGLPADVDPARLADLDRAHALTGTDNLEVLARWLEVAARRGVPGIDDRLRWFLTTIGRRKYLTPIYAAILEHDGDPGRARAIYGEARRVYHPIVQRSLDALLGVAGDGPSAPAITAGDAPP